MYSRNDKRYEIQKNGGLGWHTVHHDSGCKVSIPCTPSLFSLLNGFLCRSLSVSTPNRFSGTMRVTGVVEDLRGSVHRTGSSVLE